MRFSEDLKIEFGKFIKKIEQYEPTLNYEEILSLILSNEDYFYNVFF